MRRDGLPEEYAKAVTTYLALVFDKVADLNNSFCQWEADVESPRHLFVRQALPMIWDYGEANILSGLTGSWQSQLKRTIDGFNLIDFTTGFATVTQSSATSLPYPDDFFDAIITDPPYYDNVPYSDLSDFFYVWLKRVIGDSYSELFATPLTPKSQEIVMYTTRHGNSIEKAKHFFEEMITRSFKEIYRVLKPSGIAMIVFAYKSTDAWETIISSLLKSGLVLTASWPIHTEMKTRLRAKESAALASSVYMVCRKRVKEEVGYFNEVKGEIEKLVREKLEQFWEQGISGADFFVSAIGPAVEVFGRYSRVEKLSGEEVSVKELLEYVRKVVSEFALGRILKRPDLGGVDAVTRFYLLWRWTFGNVKVHFDDARKITQSVGGIELTEVWGGSGLVRKEKEFVRVLGPKDRVFSGKERPGTMVDALHQAVALWEKGERKKLQEMLEEAGYLRNEVFWQVAQSISDVLPEGDKERQLIQGLLYGKDAYVKGRAVESSTLLDYMKDERKE
jgi:adenine-specific DNA methylase